MRTNRPFIDAAVANVAMSDVERMTQIFWALWCTEVYSVEGEVVEFGCHRGGTSWILQHFLVHANSSRTLHLYDSFQGLPPVDAAETSHVVEGDMSATSEELIRLFDSKELPHPEVHPGWFHDIAMADIPAKISFCYLDADLYESTRIALDLVYPRLSEGGLILLDDYCNPDLAPRCCNDFPGPRRACDDFFENRPESPLVLAGAGDLSMALIRKV